MKQLLPDDWQQFIESLAKTPRTSVRINPAKPAQVFSDSEEIPWCAAGHLLNERPSFIADPLFHAGTYYVQESSSMFLHKVVETIKIQLPANGMVLDLCAAPGGKSTLLTSVLAPETLLVSNEVIRSRVRILKENLNRWGNTNNVITNNDPKDFTRLQSLFDLIVVDAPCSGEGMFRKNPRAVDEWNEGLVTLCSQRQQRILSDVLPALKPGGFLIYSTCTFNRQENEAIVQWMIKEQGLESIRIPVPPEWGIAEVQTFNETPMHAYRFYPHKVKGEGLFMCCLKKPDGPSSDPRLDNLKGISQTEIEVLRKWITSPGDIRFLKIGQTYTAVPESMAHRIQFLMQRLKVELAGIAMGELIREDLIPDHALALSTVLPSHIARAELTIDEARKFVKKETMLSSSFAQKGWSLVTYKGYALGWVKVLAGRVNNYFPTHLRVLKDIEHEDA